MPRAEEGLVATALAPGPVVRELGKRSETRGEGGEGVTMNLTTLRDTPPWEWPAGELLK